MSLSQMQVFDQYVMPATIETLAQMVAKFNAASNGAIILSTEGFDGDFYQESFWKGIHSAQRRVDRYAANGAASATDLTQDKETSVKIAGGFGPVLFEPSQLTWLRKPTAEGISVISQNLAEALLADQLNTAIAAVVAAINNGGTTPGDLVSDSAYPAGYGDLNTAHAIFGDHSGSILANVMDGTQYHSLIGENLTNTAQLFRAEGVLVVDILGKAIVVTDAPALRAANPGKTSVACLTAGAVKVFDSGDVITNVETVNGKERIETTFQVDYTFGLKVKGYAWDTANGGKSPLDAEIATSTNWDQVATSDKHTAGVLATATTPA